MGQTNSIDHCQDQDCYNLTLNYQVAKSHIEALISISQSCYQEITYNCYAAQFSNIAAWQDRNMEVHRFTGGCECNKTNSCFKVHQYAMTACNCDNRDPTQRNDTIKITDMVHITIFTIIIL